jgi:hypothetical protein
VYAPNPLAGIALKILSARLHDHVGRDQVRRDRLPNRQIVFFRPAFAILPLVLWLAWRGARQTRPLKFC